MKLRNKKTGEIFTIDNIVNDKGEKVFCLDIVPDGYEAIGVPLIKDEKIRKAVRYWAEACFNDNKFWVLDLGECDITLEADRSDAKATFYSDKKIDDIKENEFYTIAELCGEEE